MRDIFKSDGFKIGAFTLIFIVVSLWMVWYFNNDGIEFLTEVVDKYCPEKIHTSVAEVTVFLSWITAITSVVLACVAYFQIGVNYKVQFMTSIIVDAGDGPPKKAKILIRTLCFGIESKDMNKIAEEIANKIDDMSKDKDEVDNYITILSYLDFMDNIGFLFKEGRLTERNLQSMFGESLLFDYKVLSEYVKKRRAEDKKCLRNRKETNLYTNFEYLGNKLSKGRTWAKFEKKISSESVEKRADKKTRSVSHNTKIENPKAHPPHGKGRSNVKPKTME